MNIDKNNITKPKQLIGGERRDKGVLQIFFQNSDPEPPGQGSKYSTSLNGTYDITILDIKVISAAASGSEFAVQIISDTFKLERGAGGSAGANDNVKFFHRNGSNEIPNPIKLRQAEVRNWIELSFLQVGSIGTDINSAAYNILLTIEYEKL
jgi:hypothetical protein